MRGHLQYRDTLAGNEGCPLKTGTTVSWMERKTNISIIENIKPEWTLESRVTKAALSYFGHVVRAGGMEDDVMLGRMNGSSEKEKKTETEMAGHTEGVFERSHHQQHEMSCER